MHKCRFTAQVNDYLDNRLDVATRKKFEEHMRACPLCSAELEQLRKLREHLKAWQVNNAKDGFESSVQSKIAAWEMERGGVKMKTKPSVILVPAGVLVGLLVFLFVGKMYFRGDVTKIQINELAKNTTISTVKTEHLAEKFKGAPNLMMGSNVVSVSGQTLKGSRLSADYEPYYLRSSRSAVMPFTAGDASTVIPGGQYPPQSEFYEEEYSRIYDNDFLLTKENPLSTFSIDVDTASYSNVRRFLNNNQLPPEDAVRIEEMVNYFSYDYPQPTGTDPFSINTEVSTCPWNKDHRLVLIGLQGKKMDLKDMPASNLVFLIDVSGSMQDYNKLPLLKSAFRLLVDQLRPGDRVSIVVYAGSSGVVLDSVSGAEKDKIMQAIDNLQAGGSTAGAQGIVAAYEIAKKNLIKDGNNRIILATDGDFNVGITSESELLRMIEEKRNDGIFLTILGFGMGNYKDAKMEKLADKGNGSIAYIDNLLEAKKVFVNQLTGTLFTIAKDVKIQVEFNPAKVKAYRLIGYENRKLENKDFNDDKKDAGELGAGHTVTALYEVVPSDSKEEFAKTDDLKYQKVAVAPSDDLLTVKLRYKEPTGDTSKLLSKEVNSKAEVIKPSNNFEFASAVAEFGLLLRNSQYKAGASYRDVLERAKAAKGSDSDGYRADFIKLVEIAQMVDTRK